MGRRVLGSQMFRCHSCKGTITVRFTASSDLLADPGTIARENLRRAKNAAVQSGWSFDNLGNAYHDECMHSHRLDLGLDDSWV